MDCPAFVLCDDFIAGLYRHASSWCDISSLTQVCRQYNYVSKKATTNHPLEIKDVSNYDHMALAFTMAKVLIVNCSTTTGQAVFDVILKKFTSCSIVRIKFNDLKDWLTINRICKVILKRGLSIDVINAMEKEKVKDFVAKLEDKYILKHELYASNKTRDYSLKRTRADEDNDFINLRVPNDPTQRKDFLLKYLIRMNMEESQPVCPLVDIENPFAQITQVRNYTNVISVEKFFTCGVQDSLKQVQQFVNCIICFIGFSILVPSVNIFYHRHEYEDDCTFSLPDLYQNATAKCG